MMPETTTLPAFRRALLEHVLERGDEPAKTRELTYDELDELLSLLNLISCSLHVEPTLPGTVRELYEAAKTDVLAKVYQLLNSTWAAVYGLRNTRATPEQLAAIAAAVERNRRRRELAGESARL